MLIVMLMLACSGDEKDPADLDIDGDGINSVADGGDDCDDNNAGVFPGAVEVCDETDQDCDGAVDEAASDATTWYADLDDDSYGDAGQPVDDCEQPPRAVADATDCDDEDGDTNPSASERCDGGDDDCDGMIDEDAVDAVAFNVDADGDGFGVDELEEFCELPAGFAENSDDCDDANSAIYPGAEEVCDDGVDNDCSGDGDACELRGEEDVSEAPVILHGATSFNNIGEAFSAGDIDGDGEVDLLLGARTLINSEKKDYDVYTGSAFIAYGPFAESRRLDEATDPTLLPQSQASEFGRAVSVVGDVNGDDIADLLVSNPLHATALATPGAAWLFYGGERWEGARTVEDADAVFVGTTNGDGFGEDVAGAGDINGDGLADMLMTQPGLSLGGNPEVGAVYLVLGSETLPTNQTVTDPHAEVVGTGARERVGYSASVVGDHNGDGYADLLIGTSDASRPAWLVWGPLEGELSLDTKSAVSFVRGRTGEAETAVASAGDLDGDTLADLLIGSPLADGLNPGTQAGEVAIWYSSVETLLSGTLDLDDAHGRLYGEDDDQRAGHVVAGVGDIDGDGVDDLATGAPEYGESSTLTRGAAYLMYGMPMGLTGLADADARLRGLIGDGAGDTVAGAGDLNADGYGDVWVGAPYSSSIEQEAGALYLLRGGAM